MCETHNSDTRIGNARIRNRDLINARMVESSRHHNILITVQNLSFGGMFQLFNRLDHVQIFKLICYISGSRSGRRPDKTILIIHPIK